MRCCLCGEEMALQESNNAQPVEDGRCCQGCNWSIVLPARLEILNEKEDDSIS